MKKNKIWDFNESTGYIKVKYKGGIYKVLNRKGNNKIVEILHFCKVLIDNISKIIAERLPLMEDKQLIKMCEVFLNIHPYNYEVAEMQKDTGFIGMNKPIAVHITDGPSVGKDKKLRAESRRVFLEIRDENNNLKPIESIISLVIHEIAHTGCNHVTWRDDDHGKDFIKFEKFLYEILYILKILCYDKYIGDGNFSS